MAVVTERGQPAARGTAQPLRLVHYLAIAGAVLLAFQLSVWIAWLADGVHQETAFRTHGSTSWYAARAFEVGGILMLIGVGGWVIAGCRREGRLTFDAKFCIAGLLSFWLDPVANFAQPSWFYSQNWVNVNDWIPDMPMHQRTVEMIEAPLINVSTYTVGFLLIVIAINAAMRAAARRWPSISAARLLAVASVAALAIFVAFLLPGFLLELWAYPGQPDELALLSGANRIPITEWALVPLVMFVPLAAWRFFADDRGRHLLERDLERHRPRLRQPLSLLAMVGLFNLILLSVEMLHVGFATYSDPFPRTLPKPIIAEVCDPPGQTGPAYGPCPGTPGYKLPLSSTNPDLGGP